MTTANMTTANDNASFHALTFALSGETVAIDAGIVREILDVIPVTEVPGARDFVGGLINVRGKVVPLADIKLKLGMPPCENSLDTRIVVVEIALDGDPTTIGLLADKVFEVTEIAVSAIQAAPDIGIKWPPEFIRGIGKHAGEFIVIPDMDRIFSAA